MSIGGGEILRATLEASSVWSAPAFYTMTLNANNGVAQARARERTFLQCHKDRYFLQMGLVPTGTENTGFQRIDEFELIRLYDPSNDNDYAFQPQNMVQSLYSESAIAFSDTTPEYILWGPGSLIGLEWVGANFNGQNQYKFLTLLGIEYWMKG